MAWALETPVARGVHVQQVARARPLVAVGRLLRRPRRARDAVTAEHLPDRRVGLAGSAGDQPRPPTSVAPALADALLELGLDQPRHPPRATRAIQQPAARTQLLLARAEPPVPPAMGGRRRH